MTPATFDLTIYRGDSFEKKLTFLTSEGNPIDLTGYTFLAQCRISDARTASLLFQFTPQLAFLANGIVTLTLTPSDTASRDATETAYWDLQLTTSSGFVQTYLYGSVTILGDISKA